MKRFYCLDCGSGFDSDYKFGEPCPYCKCPDVREDKTYLHNEVIK
jgi:hypothetical protein